LVYSEIILAPGSGKKVSLTLEDGLGNPIDFTTGTWSARLVIVPYARYSGAPFATLITTNAELEAGPVLEWLTLTSESNLIINPDPELTLTSPWKFTRYHYDCWIKGPNLNSAPDRIGHGPFKMDW
jgi:hypothetical protein